MALLNKKLDGFTLVETIVSMLIVMLVFGMGTTVYVNVLNSDNHASKLKAGNLLSQISVETKVKKVFSDEKITIDEYSVVKTVTPYNGSEDLSLLRLRAYDRKEKLVSERRELIFIQ